jgi:3'(2'), 5'-bisphosphate nucleotidase
MITPAQINEFLEPVKAAAIRAGEEVLRLYNGADPVAKETKRDGSPVTAADLAADGIIIAALKALAPGIAIITEETFTDDTALPATAPFWLVDPIHGTKEFISRTGEFTVNIALIDGDKSVLGVIYAPVFDELYWGGQGIGAFQRVKGKPQPIAARLPPAEGLTLISSRFHGNPERLQDFMAKHKVVKNYQRGSSYKFCEVARGGADVFPYFGKASEWDTAAGQAIVEAAGGTVMTEDGAPLLYRKPTLRNPRLLIEGKR